MIENRPLDEFAAVMEIEAKKLLRIGAYQERIRIQKQLRIIAERAKKIFGEKGQEAILYAAGRVGFEEKEER